MFSTFDDPLVKVTPWHTLSKEMRTLLITGQTRHQARRLTQQRLRHLMCQ